MSFVSIFWKAFFEQYRWTWRRAQEHRTWDLTIKAKDLDRIFFADTTKLFIKLCPCASLNEHFFCSATITTLMMKQPRTVSLVRWRIRKKQRRFLKRRRRRRRRRRLRWPMRWRLCKAPLQKGSGPARFWTLGCINDGLQCTWCESFSTLEDAFVAERHPKVVQKSSGLRGKM